MPVAAGRQAIDALLVRPDTKGQKVLLGVVWFVGASLSILAGRWPAALFWAGAAAFAAAQTVRAWEPPGSRRADPLHVVESAAVAALVPLAAGWSTGLAGLVLVLGALSLPVSELLRGRRPAAAGAAAIGALLPAVAAASVVLATRVNLLTALFLVLAVSMFDAGFYLMGAEAPHRWEGLVGGVVGVLAVTFMMGAFAPPPFQMASAWLAGAVMAVSCPVGQWVATLFLPRRATKVGALRRLDSYLLAGPLFVAFVWMLGG
ncbi:MAG: hypothetical protein ACKO04_10000 [Actinomycetes bacterium]